MSWLRKIVDFVDRDVKANNKPLSTLVAIIPVAPFMFFMDGVPMDRAPILSGIAFGACIAWLVFVMWRLVRQRKIEIGRLIAQSHEQQRARKVEKRG